MDIKAQADAVRAMGQCAPHPPGTVTTSARDRDHISPGPSRICPRGVLYAVCWHGRVPRVALRRVGNRWAERPAKYSRYSQ